MFEWDLNTSLRTGMNYSVNTKQALSNNTLTVCSQFSTIFIITKVTDVKPVVSNKLFQIFSRAIFWNTPAAHSEIDKTSNTELFVGQEIFSQKCHIKCWDGNVSLGTVMTYLVIT